MTGNRGAAPGLRPLRASLYSIAVCAQRADAIPPVRSSIHLDPEDDLFLKQEATMRWASGLHEEHEQLKRQIKISQEAFEAIKNESESAADAARTLAATVSDLTRQRDQVSAQLAQTQRALANAKK